jgi:hypothetical protein
MEDLGFERGFGLYGSRSLSAMQLREFISLHETQANGPGLFSSFTPEQDSIVFFISLLWWGSRIAATPLHG